VARATFRNRIAWALWIFMGVWMAFLALMTFVLLRDGPPPGYSWPTMWAVMFFFWTAGVAATAWATTHRTVRVDVADSGAIEVTWRSPFRVERRRVEAADVPRAELISGRDSDGDPWFTCRITLADGAVVDLAESHDAASMERIAGQFNAVAGRQPRRPSSAGHS